MLREKERELVGGGTARRRRRGPVGVEGLREAADSHCRHGFVLEGDEGHAQWLSVDLLLLLPVLLLQLGFPLGVEAHRLLLQVDKLYYTHWARLVTQETVVYWQLCVSSERLIDFNRPFVWVIHEYLPIFAETLWRN